MRHTFSAAMWAVAFLLGGIGCAPEDAEEASKAAPEDAEDASEAAPAATYDSLLAQEIGADEWGMRRYVMALLKAGPNRGQDSASAAELQRGHMDNIRRMAEEGQLILAGPFLDEGVLRGVYVFDVETVEEARALTETDPAIQAGRLEMELHPWYGSAALMKVPEIHERVTVPSD